jgi:hypothetical protein
MIFNKKLVKIILLKVYIFFKKKFIFSEKGW